MGPTLLLYHMENTVTYDSMCVLSLTYGKVVDTCLNKPTFLSFEALLEIANSENRASSKQTPFYHSIYFIGIYKC